MIKITKPPAPAVLAKRGAARRDKHCRDYDFDPAGYDEGRKTFPLDAKIYADAAVKQALIDAQHGKCCFCEEKVGVGGDVEHFRPKGGVCQGEDLPLERPGYYWLAYDWGNLLLACRVCNQHFKASYFPLLKPADRARNHHGGVSREEPLLIHPAQEDPALLIGFRQEVPYAIRGSRRARETIRLLGLNRSDLTEKRRGCLKNLILLRDVVGQSAKLRGSVAGRRVLAEAEDVLQKATLDSAEFASMARAAAVMDSRLTLP